MRAVERYDLGYADLKEIVRNSLEFSFLPGTSLWDGKSGYRRFVAACESDAPAAEVHSPACAALLNSSEKAAQQWELERRFHSFEASF